jgi:hypothetical protein
MAMHQAQHAEDPALREAMRTIADDEVRHGELAWAIHAWAQQNLSEEALSAIDAAMRDAAHALVDDVTTQDLDPESRAFLGLPSPEDARALAKAVNARLWSSSGSARKIGVA